MTTPSPPSLSEELTIEHIENELFYLGNSFPKKAVQAAIAQHSSITPKLIAWLNQAIEDVSSVGDDDIGHFFAVFLLSQFQEKAAFESIISLARLPEEDIDYLIGDCLTDDLHRFIASTYNGDLPIIKKLIEDPQVNLWSRSAGIDALILLTKEGKLDRDETAGYLSSLFTHSSVLNNPSLMAYLVLSCCALDTPRFLDEIQNAFDEEKVDTFVVNRDDVKEKMHPPKEQNASYYSLIKDSITEMEHLPLFTDFGEEDIESTSDSMISTQAVIQTPKAGRNEPCPCGSGKKYKKCCL